MRPFFEKCTGSLRGEVLAAEPLSRHTTWRIGGPADLFIVPADRADLMTALRLLKDEGVPWLVLGYGSNVLVRDGGVRGAVICPRRLRRITFDGGKRVRVEGGLPLMALVREAARRGLAGVETLAGIPGSVGGAVAMNAGAGGREMADLLMAARIAGEEGEEEWRPERFAFGYRSSAVGAERIVVEATLQLRGAAAEEVQAELRQRLAHRRQAQNVGFPNAGSVFKNPPGQPAWRLIEEAGMRGARAGGAKVSEVHANFIVNVGGATAADVESLIERVRRTVHRKHGIRLEPEVRVIGEGMTG